MGNSGPVKIGSQNIFNNKILKILKIITKLLFFFVKNEPPKLEISTSGNTALRTFGRNNFFIKSIKGIIFAIPFNLYNVIFIIYQKINK